MGPFSEMKQLERKASVLALLQQNNLSEWARDYWGLVLDRITLDEARYNDRVVQLYKDRERQTGWINYE